MTEVFAKESVLQNTSTDVVYSYSFSILISCQFGARLARVFYIFPDTGARKLFCILLVICVSFNYLFLPQVFLAASFLELLEQSLAIIFSYKRPLVVNRKAADLVALRRLRKMADGSRRGAELLEQVAERLFCFCWSHACWCLIIHEPGLGCKAGWRN